MRPLIDLLAALALFAGPCCALAFADGGQVRAMERHGDCQITVFTSPSPLRAGPIDVSVLLQDAQTGRVVADADITVELTPQDGSHPPLRVDAVRADATNKLLRAALVELPTSGRWEVRVEYKLEGGQPAAAVAFAMEAAPPLPPWLAVWPWFAWPLVVILLFVVHRALVARRAGKRAGNRSLAKTSPPVLVQLTP